MRHLCVALAVLLGLTLNLTPAHSSSPATSAPLTPPNIGGSGGLRSEAAATVTGFDFVPGSLTLAPGGANTVDLRLREAVSLAAYEVQLAFNPAVIAIDRVDRLVGVPATPGRTWASLPATSDPNVTYIVVSPGVIAFGAYSFGEANTALNGDVLLARLHVRAVGTGSSALHLNMTLVSNPDAQGSQPPGVDGSVTIDTGGSACVTGRVQLQGRADFAGTTVGSGGVTTQTAADGLFNLCGLAAGPRTVRASRPGYLAREAHITLGTTPYGLSVVTLLGGDINGDDEINIFDLVSIGNVYGAPAAVRPAADVNGNGTIDIFDLIMVGANYGRPGPQTWNKGHVETEDGRLKTDEGKRRVTVSVVQPEKVAAGEVFEVAVRVTGGDAVLGADLTLHFDPSRLEVLGLSTPGDVWAAGQTYVALNAVDRATGEVRFAATALGRPLRVGDGALLTLRLRALADGPSHVRIATLDLVNARGERLTPR